MSTHHQILLVGLSLFLAANAAGADPAAHWSFRPPVRPPIPAVRQAAWIRTPIDAFILAELEARKLTPAPEADRLTLLRRVTVDLTGLPPTPQEQAAFLADSRPDAYERLVERLLQSPHYAERQAQHWLDVVRYAESNGYEADSERPHAWRYRDYVVRCFQSDLPFDRFLTEQVAGDLVPGAGPDTWIAVGLHRCGPIHIVGGNSDPEVSRQELLTEMVNGVGSAFLGLTIGCARCHDHKFDPILQADYYRLQAFFAGTMPKERDLANAIEKARHTAAVAAIQAKIAPLAAKVAAIDSPYRNQLGAEKRAALEPKYKEALAVPADKRTAEQKKLVEHANVLIKVTWDEIVAALTPSDRATRQALRAQIHALEAKLPEPPTQAWSVTENDKPATTHLLKRGDVKQKGEVIAPGFPVVLTNGPAPKQRLTRLDLAKWLARPEHPLTTRVWVNRIWQQHFNRGLVATPNDYGIRGGTPTHPALLDWLATELVQHGWSTRHLHRVMVLSATYRQSSRGDTTTLHADPENRWLGRMNRRRLDGEALRDHVLAAAGTLNPMVGGPMVRVPLEPEVYDLIFTEGEPDGLWRVTPDERLHTRRSLYLFAKRNVRQPLLEAFDQPDTLNSCPQRPVSTFAPQALILMNGPVAQEQSRNFARRLLGESVRPTDLVENGFRIALGRPPRPSERSASLEFLARQTELLRQRVLNRQPVALPPDLPDSVPPALAGAVTDFCLALMNLNEFVYID